MKRQEFKQAPTDLQSVTFRFGDRPSGSLTTFLRRYKQAQATGNSDVPCNGCTACCRDPKLFIDITEQEARSLKSHWEDKDGEWKLDRNEKGECVYLIDGCCSIYSDRPQSCRKFDCRIHLLGFPVISEQEILLQEGVLGWSPFSLPTTEDKVTYLAIKISIKTLLSKNSNPSFGELGNAIASWSVYREIAYEMYHAIRRMSEEEATAFINNGVLPGVMP